MASDPNTSSCLFCGDVSQDAIKIIKEDAIMIIQEFILGLKPTDFSFTIDDIIFTIKWTLFEEPPGCETKTNKERLAIRKKRYLEIHPGCIDSAALLVEDILQKEFSATLEPAIDYEPIFYVPGNLTNEWRSKKLREEKEARDYSEREEECRLQTEQREKEFSARFEEARDERAKKFPDEKVLTRFAFLLEEVRERRKN